MEVILDALRPREPREDNHHIGRETEEVEAILDVLRPREHRPKVNFARSAIQLSPPETPTPPRSQRQSSSESEEIATTQEEPRVRRGSGSPGRSTARAASTPSAAASACTSTSTPPTTARSAPTLLQTPPLQMRRNKDQLFLDLATAIVKDHDAYGHTGIPRTPMTDGLRRWPSLDQRPPSDEQLPKLELHKEQELRQALSPLRALTPLPTSPPRTALVPPLTHTPRREGSGQAHEASAATGSGSTSIPSTPPTTPINDPQEGRFRQLGGWLTASWCWAWRCCLWHAANRLLPEGTSGKEEILESLAAHGEDRPPS